MTKLLKSCVVALLISSAAHGQYQYSRIKIDLHNRDISDIAKLGLEADHGIYLKNQYLINDYSESELRILQKNGIGFEMLIGDVQEYYRNGQTTESHRFTRDCEGLSLKSTHKKPKNFYLGSMGGYFTYAETWQQIDRMRLKYPELVSQYQPIDTFRTFEGNPIRFLKFGINPGSSNLGKPKTLFTALHHAREPLGLSQMIYFMWYLLENYENDAEIKALLDNTELFFVPIVNPDGYLFNELSNPEGGGMWRKNRRINADSTIGTDLNRNYGYAWGADNTGSSPDPNSEVYRGEAPFSEPENQALRFLCQKYHFGTALNYHSFGNYLIFPFSYNDQPADPAFFNISDVIAKQNNYVIGTSSQTVSYRTNGSSDDWMWGSENIYSMTPEVSSEGFWPDSSLIRELCAESLNMNLRSAQIAGSYATLRPVSVPPVVQKNDEFAYDVQRLGKTDSVFFISLLPLSNNILTKAESKRVSLSPFEKTMIKFNVALKTTILEGDKVSWVLTMRDSLNTFSHVDTVKCIHGGKLIFSEQADKTDGWKNTGNNGNWTITQSTFKSSPSALTDSPLGKYSAGCNAVMRTSNYITLPKKEKIFLRFWAKWEIEKGVDYANVSISENNFSYTYLCGKHSHPGTYQQIDGEPVYDGISDWVQEEIDLSEYAGKKILLRFSMVSDFTNQMDGIYIDDIEIVAQLENQQSTRVIGIDPVEFESTVYPNPANQRIKLKTPLSGAVVKLELFDISGVNVLQIFTEKTETEIDLSTLPAGCYILRITSDEMKTVSTGKFIKI